MSLAPRDFTARFVPIIKAVAAQYALDPLLVEAMVFHESLGNPWATAYEPLFKYFLDLPGNAKKVGTTIPTEQMMQATSWGLMQVMGGVARQHAFDQNIPYLCDPRTGIDYGCRHLAHFMKMYRNVWDAVSAYNHGWAQKMPDGTYFNQKDYVDPVRAAYMLLVQADASQGPSV